MMTDEVLHNGMPLDWNLPMNLIGEKVTHPVLHICDLCQCPIAVYGRHIPCKHVFCMECANRQGIPGRRCEKCGDSVIRSERADISQVFMCTSDMNNPQLACKRTYLSLRDLQAHVNHRHRRSPAIGGNVGVVQPVYVPQTQSTAVNYPPVHPLSQPPFSSPPPPSSNLIMINIQPPR